MRGVRHLIIVVAVVGLSLCVAGPVGQAMAAIETTLYEPFIEWAAPNATYDGNPFDLPAAVTFTHTQTGTTRTASMFYDGADQWKFRFAGDLTGEWTFTSSSPDADLDGLSGAVVVKPQTAAGTAGYGHIVAHGTKWAWQAGDGQLKPFVPQLVMYSGEPTEYHPGANADKIDQDIDTFLNQHGFNGFHVPSVAGRWFDFEAADHAISVDMTNPDPRTFEALEQLIIKTHAAGGMVHIWAWGDDQRSQTPLDLAGGIGGEVEQRLNEYIAARLGALPGWTMGYGFDLNEWVTAGKLKEWKQAFDAKSGWDHMLGGRPAGPNGGGDHKPAGKWNDGLGYASYEHHKPTYDVYVAALENVNGDDEPLNLPVLSEDRFRIRDKAQYRSKDYTEEDVRRGMWVSTMAGGVGNIWGDLMDPATGEASSPFEHPQWSRTWKDFFDKPGRFTLDMVRRPDLTVGNDTYVLFDPVTRKLIVYAEDTDHIQLKLFKLLTDGDLVELLADPETGGGAGQILAPGPMVRIKAVNTLNVYEEIDLGLADIGHSTQGFKLPGNSDWALELTILPEPTSLALLGVVGLLVGGRRRRR